MIVTADDFGLTRATSEACLTAHREGVVTAVSALGNGAATMASLGLLDDAPGLEVGIHLALVGEDPPVSPPSAIPSLVDGAGRLRTDWRAFVRDLTRRRIQLDDVRTEVDAQISRLEAEGVVLTHANVHQHLHLWPAIGRTVVDVAVQHGIGFVRTPSSRARGPRGIEIRRLATRLRRTCRAAGLATTDGFAGLDEAGGWDADRFVRTVTGDPSATLEVNLHPGLASDPDRGRFTWGYRWASELDLLCDPRIRRAVDDADCELVGPSAVAVPGGAS